MTDEPEAPEDLQWHRLRRGDEAAFRTVFADHHKAVYNFAFRHAASWAVAEEATQAAFASLWRRAKAGSLPGLGGATVRGWLFGVVRNECRNAARSTLRQLRVATRLEPGARGRADNVDAWLDHETSMRRITQVLSRIPDRQRRVVELVWAGLGPAEIAATLGIPVGTAKSRLSRARATLATTDVADLLKGGE